MGIFNLIRFSFLLLCLSSIAGTPSSASSAAFERTDDYLYVNRKTTVNANATFDALIRNLELEFRFGNRLVRIADFNTRQADMAANNIIAFADGPSFTKKYADLSPEVRARTIFEPFLNRLLNSIRGNGSRLIHIDHHYPFRVFSFNSTTVLTVDFLTWLYEQKDRGAITQRTLLATTGALADSFAVLDHSDADIVLSNLACSRARDRDWLRRHGARLKAVALFNDYVVESDRTPEERARTRLLFDLILGIDKSIANNEIDYRAGFDYAATAIEFVDTLHKRISEPAEEWEKRCYAIFSSAAVEGGNLLALSQTEKWIPKMFVKVFRNYLRQSERMAALSGTIRRIDSVAGVDKNGLYRMGNVLILYPDPTQGPVDSSTSLRWLRSEASHILDGVRVLATVSVQSTPAKTFLKLRAVTPLANLDSLYPLLRAAGLDADGRNEAGSGAYGKSGREGVSIDELRRDLASVSEGLAAIDLAPLLDKCER